MMRLAGSIVGACVLVTGFVALSAQVSASPLVPKHPALSRYHSASGDWQLDIVRNLFSEQVGCRLIARNRQSFYQGGAVGFRFKRSWNVHEAFYRVESGSAREWRLDLPELVRSGAPIDRGGVENASEGIVWIPFSRLVGNQSIAIQARTDRPARTFRFRGLEELYTQAVGLGCFPDSRFVH